MAQKIYLDGTHVLKFEQKINTICRPLRDNLNVPFFKYSKLFNDGSRIILSNFSAPMQFIYEEGYYPATWHDNEKGAAAYTGGTLIWAIQKLSNSDVGSSLNKEINKLFNLREGAVHSIKHPDFLEVFDFAATGADIYNIRPATLQRFMYYFKEQARKIIVEAESDKIIVPANQSVVLDNLTKIDEDKFIAATPITNYCLQGKYDGIILSSKEVECLKWCVNGKSAEETAMILNMRITKRTVEQHLSNVKKKVGISRQSELITFAIEQGLV